MIRRMQRFLNNFSSNAVENLKIPEYQEADPHANNISLLIFKAIMKFRNHPSITAIKNLNKDTRSDFCRVSVEDVVKEIKKLSTEKGTQSTDILAKILKKKTQIFLEATSVNCQRLCRKRRFLFYLKTDKDHTSF